MQIFLHRLDGSQRVVQITSDLTAEELILNEELSGSILVSQGSVLRSDFNIADLPSDANIFENDGLDGGKKKKKKKQYTTKKKNKHIHKKIKLLPMTLYSVDGTFRFNA